MFKEVEMMDYEFAKWLKDHGWTGKYEVNHINNVNYFMVEEKVIATVLYNNSKCTRRIFINPDLERR